MKKLILILFVVSLVSCFSSRQIYKNTVYGFDLGDTLSNKFIVTKVQDFPFSMAKYKKDTRVEVSLIDGHISAFTFNDLKRQEYVRFKQEISNMMKFRPKYYEKDSPYGVRINGNMYHWNDSITGIEVVLGENAKKDSIFRYLSIYNRKLSDSLKNIFIPDIDEEYEFMEVK